MAVAIAFQFGDKFNVIGFKLTMPPKRVKPRQPSIWQRVKKAAFDLLMDLMPAPLAFA